MGQWAFNEANPSSVWTNPNQGDQFNNDDVGLGEALVREVIQNSTDAGEGNESVKVRFQISRLQGQDVLEIRRLLQPLKPHLEECQIDTSPLQDNTDILVLSIEDFNTSGLTGSFTERDSKNFSSFWRDLARSEKTGKAGGRWGLGKLVFSSSSQIGAFFGLTIRSDDNACILMGQAVLKHHEINGTSHEPHGFWFATRHDNRLQLPVTDQTEINTFSNLARLARTDQPGLSIIIPYLAEGITNESIVEGVIGNYYFPILAGKLEVEVGDITINADTFLEIAEEHSQTATPFEFVKEVSLALNKEPEFTAIEPVGRNELSEASFRPEDIEEMKSRFSNGGLLKAKIPVLLRPKNAADILSYIDVYLQALPENGQSFALFSRGAIILTAERSQFRGSMSYGALVASESQLEEFLGDSENPAHTKWNPRAEKLKNKWRMPHETLTTIRHSLKNLYDLVAEQEVMEDTDALLEFFSIKEPEKKSTGSKTRTDKPSPEVEPRETAIRIQPKIGGFEIHPGPGAAKWEFPRTIRIRLAYDMIGANPFKRFSIYDFDLQKGKEIRLSADNADIRRIRPNILALDVKSPEFHLEATGFDPNRDLVVEARVVEQKS
ncbi:MAG: hypothetical protein V3V13_03900 [Paracoccaceae bacterium]